MAKKIANLKKAKYTTNMIVNKESIQKRIMFGVPMTGLVRAEWMLARYGQIIPCNWSHAEIIQFIDQYSPIGYTVADARNIISNEAVRQGFEWLFFIDHDVILPQTTLLKINERIINSNIPVFSGLYFTKSLPSEPLIYRGFGNGYFSNWELGDDVWVSAVPMGCTVINVKLLEVMYYESEEYSIGGIKYRKIFETPNKAVIDIETGNAGILSGTEDIEWSKRVIKDKIFEKAGFKEFQNKKYPFLVDTSIFCKHIDFNGKQYPSAFEETRFIPKKWKNKTIDQIKDELKIKFNML